MINILKNPLLFYSQGYFPVLYVRVREDIGCAAALPMGVAPEASANRLRLGEGYVAVLLQPCPGRKAFPVLGCAGCWWYLSCFQFVNLLRVVMGSLELNNFIGGRKILGSEGASSLDRPKC